jgi:hypothetical protein
LVTARQASIGTPLCLTAGSGLLTYAWLMHRRFDSLQELGQGPRVHPHRVEPAILGLAIVFVILNVFRGTTLFAEDLGQGKAHHLEFEGFSNQPDVLLYSSHRLKLDAKDVTATDLRAQIRSVQVSL